jgi:quinol monooxygenase YgiN
MRRFGERCKTASYFGYAGDTGGEAAMALTILAQIIAMPGSEAHLRAELEKLVVPTRAEAGCLQYDLHVDTGNPEFFVFIERWESLDLWQAHMKAPHLADYVAATEGAVLNVTLNELAQIA